MRTNANCEATLQAQGEDDTRVDVRDFESGTGGFLSASATLKFGLETLDADFNATACDHLEAPDAPEYACEGA